MIRIHILNREIAYGVHIKSNILIQLSKYLEGLLKQGSICETRKGPNRPPPPIPRGSDFLVYAHVLENQSFCAFRPNSAISGGQNCQKATYEMSLFPGLYDHPLQRYSLEKNR